VNDQHKPNIAFTSEQAGLPSWLFPAGFWAAVGALAVAVLYPQLALWAVGWVMPAMWVAGAAWKLDRRLSVAALIALAGLAVVFVVKGLLG
jgi:hypothetical protein